MKKIVCRKMTPEKKNVFTDRLISILLAISKILERAVETQLYTYLRENNLISS